MKLFKFKGGDCEIFQIDAQNFKRLYDENGGQEIFGSSSIWGDISNRKVKNLSHNPKSMLVS